MSEIMVICGHFKFNLRTDDPRLHAGVDSLLVCLLSLLVDVRDFFSDLGSGGGGGGGGGAEKKL